MTRDEIKQKVKVRLDEVSPLENKNPVNDILTDEFLDSAVTDLYMILPTWMINSTVIPNPRTLTGTIATNAGTPTLTGTGTKFLTEARVGDYITVAGQEVEIISITSDLLLTVGTNIISTTSGSATIPTQYYTTGEKTGYVELPTNFLKLVYFEMDDWARPAINAISVDDPKYILQKNVHTRGGQIKPIVAIRSDVRYKVLEYYSTVSHTISKALYIGTDEAEDVQSDLIEPLVWMISSNVFQVLEKHKEAEQAKQKVVEFIQSR